MLKMNVVLGESHLCRWFASFQASSTLGRQVYHHQTTKTGWLALNYLQGRLEPLG